MDAQKEFIKQIFVEVTYEFYYQLYFLCIIGYFVFQLYIFWIISQFVSLNLVFMYTPMQGTYTGFETEIL